MRTPMPLFTGVKDPTILTETRVAKKLDFSAPVNCDLGFTLELEALATGLLNCARLTSIVQLGPGTVFSGSDSLMPPTIVPLAHNVPVEVGDRVRLCGLAVARSSLSASVFEAEIL